MIKELQRLMQWKKCSLMKQYHNHKGGRLLMKKKKGKFTEHEETGGPIKLVHGANKTKAPQVTFEQVGDIEEERKPHDPATKILGPPKEVWKTRG
jgi:hypothetical protein